MTSRQRALRALIVRAHSRSQKASSAKSRLHVEHLFACASGPERLPLAVAKRLLDHEDEAAVNRFLAP